MRYCPNDQCGCYGSGTGTFCPDCGTELVPFIRCRCGKEEFNPKQFPSGERSLLPKFCEGCGTALTDAYLGQCMAAQLQDMVGAIAEKASTLD